MTQAESFEQLLESYQGAYTRMKTKHPMMVKIIEAMQPEYRRDIITTLQMNQIATDYREKQARDA